MDQASPIAILMVEDNPGDARLVRESLGEAGGFDGFAITAVDRLAAARAALAEGRFDVILLDLSLPDSQGLETLEEMRQATAGTPIVVLTGLDDEELALKAMQGGAQDYLVKGQGGGDLVRRAIRYAIERSRVDEVLRQSEARFRAIFERTSIGILLFDREGRCLDANPAFLHIIGCSDCEPQGQHLRDFIHPDDAEHGLQVLLGVGEQPVDGHCHLEHRYLRRDGAVIWARVNATALRDAQGNPLFTVAMIEDITERKAMEDRLRLAAKVLESTSEGIFVTDAARRIIHVNPAFTQLTGYAPEDVLGRKPNVLSSGRHDAAFYERLRRSLEQTGKWQGEIWNRRKTGELFAEWLNISVVRNERDEITNYVAVFSDITSRKQTEERLSYQAHHDPLTSLPNRTLFHERLSRALARAARTHQTVALLFLDLDHFKEVNDACGHLVGDALLQTVAERLTNCTRQGDTVARLAGDEFTVILEDITDFRDAAAVAQKILRQLSEPFVLNGYRLTITTSIGISLYPSDGNDIQTLLRFADEAMYRAKKQGKDSYQFYSETLNAQAFERLALESSLVHALERQELKLYYQPILDLRTNRIAAAEALLRWQHPEAGVVLPAQFLNLAEETGLILPIDRWVMGAACAQLRQWHDRGFTDLRLSVNLSGQHLNRQDLVDAVAGALRDSGLEAGFLEIELPEGVVMGKGQDHSEALAALKELGCRLAIDDFGTGFSSFGYLRRLPVDSLKIDQSFVRDIMTDADDAKIITAITAIAHSLHMNVVAEGVETAEQLSFLHTHQCDMAQGFLFSRPLPPAEFLELLETRSAVPT